MMEQKELEKAKEQSITKRTFLQEQRIFNQLGSYLEDPPTGSFKEGRGGLRLRSSTAGQSHKDIEESNGVDQIQNNQSDQRDEEDHHQEWLSPIDNSGDQLCQPSPKANVIPQSPEANKQTQGRYKSLFRKHKAKFKQNSDLRRRSNGRETPTLQIEDISNRTPEKNAKTGKMAPAAKAANNKKKTEAQTQEDE